MTITQLRQRADRDGLWGAVAGNVRAEAARRGFNQLKLAAAIGMSRAALGERWRGDTQWQLVDLERLADLFGIDPSELLRTRRDSNPKPSDLESPDTQVIALDTWRADREAVASCLGSGR